MSSARDALAHCLSHALGPIPDGEDADAVIACLREQGYEIAPAERVLPAMPKLPPEVKEEPDAGEAGPGK